MPPVFSMALPLLWLVRALALAAVATSGWLTVQKWLNPRVSLAGCGGSEGCAALLESRWSNWFSVPVTLLAATLWLALLLLTLPTAGRWLGRTADQLLAACAVLLLAGALWFGTLMLGVAKIWCPWCLMLHVSALTAGTIVLYCTWKASREGGAGLFSAAGQAGIAGMALLVLGQLFGKAPDTHLLTGQQQKQAPPAPVKPETPPVPPPAGMVSYFGGELTFSLQEMPLVGSPEATHILASFGDYTCPSCRAQHDDLKALLEAAPETYAYLVLPTPLEKSCNRWLPPDFRDQPGSCALARLSLAFWKAAPAQFAAFHHYLMSGPHPMDPALARAEAARLAPHAVLEEDSPWITARLARNADAWHFLSTETDKLPKLLLRDDVVIHGPAATRERFREILKETFISTFGAGIPVTTPVR